jgi:hypothetical protein
MQSGCGPGDCLRLCDKSLMAIRDDDSALRGTWVVLKLPSMGTGCQTRDLQCSHRRRGPSGSLEDDTDVTSEGGLGELGRNRGWDEGADPAQQVRRRAAKVLPPPPPPIIIILVY